MCSFAYFGENLQESNSLVMRESIFFHDVGLYVMFGVAFLVGVILMFSWVGGFSSTSYLEKKWLEIGWTVLPTLILVFLALPSLQLLFYLEAPQSMSPKTTVKVIGHQWYWGLNYEVKSEEMAHDTYLVPQTDLMGGSYRNLEVDLPLILYIFEYSRLLATAVDVLHSFALPSLGVKLDSVPGRMNQQYVFPDMLGVFYGQCSEMCGANHSFMPVSIEVINSSLKKG